MLNNKGQSLILFVVVLPILLLIVVLVIDVGRVLVLKQELDNINEIVLEYGLDNLNNENLEDELEALVELNNNEIDKVDIRFEDNKIYIELDDEVDGIFSGLINISLFNVKSSYMGYIDNNNKRIEKISG